MIATVHGVVQQIQADAIILEVGGIGLNIEVPVSVIDACPGIGKQFLLHTQMVVRDDSIKLFGFISSDQRDLYNLLVKIDGVGPKLALSILSTLSPETLQSAVTNNQAGVLETVPGIGKKTAEKIIFFLKDRLAEPIAAMGPPSTIDNEVLGALLALGYSPVEAQAAIKTIPADATEEVEERVRLALQYFAQS